MFIIYDTCHFIHKNNQLRLGLIELGIGLIELEIGLIELGTGLMELGIGLRINKARRTVYPALFCYLWAIFLMMP